MPVYKLFIIYGLTAIVFFIIDIFWIGYVANDWYDKWIGHLRGEVNWYAAIVFYAIFIMGILFYGVMPGLEKESAQHALFCGALFGFFTYATYDLTNMATLKNWPIKMVIIDILWGMFLSSSVSLAGYYIATWVKNW